MYNLRTKDMLLTPKKALYLTVIGGIFVIPFVALATHPYIAIKGFVFQILVELITVAWLALTITNTEYRPRRSILLAMSAFYVLVMLVADLFGLDPYTSFWSSYERMGGLLTLIHVFLYIMVASSMLASEESWRSLFKTSLAVSGIVGIYGFLQLFGIFADTWQTGSMPRVDATLGNPDFLGTYAIFHIFIASLFLSTYLKGEPQRGKQLPLVALYVLLIINTTTLLVSGTRGAVLGLFCGLSLLFALIMSFPSTRKYIVAASIACALVIGSSLLVVGGLYAHHENSILERYTTFSIDDNIHTRVLLTEIAWQGVKEHPILGWGQENYAIVFFKHNWPRLDFGLSWSSRVHNTVLQQLVDGGIVSLISYFSLFVAAIWILIKDKRHSSLEKIIIIALLGGYFVQNLSLFDTTTSYILFGTILAYIVYIETVDRQGVINPTEKPISVELLVLSLMGALIMVSLINGPALQANYLLFQAVSDQPEGPQKNLEYFRKAIGLHSFGTTEARLNLARFASTISTNQNVDSQTRADFFYYTKQQLEQQVNSFPFDAIAMYYLGLINNKNGNYAEARDAFQKALILSPDNQNVLYQLAINAVLAGDNSSALEYLKRSHELNPQDTEIRIRYACLAIYMGNTSLGDTLLADIVTNEDVDDRIIKAYFSVNQPEKNVQLLRNIAERHPDNQKVAIYLMTAYSLMGDRTQSTKVMERLIEAVPGVAVDATDYMNKLNSENFHITPMHAYEMIGQAN
jgi:O-antigen ligase/tetratricopeptide (TPR) repeat protein